MTKIAQMPRSSRKINTTLGDLLAAAYEAADGRTEGAAELLQSKAISRMLGRKVRFI